MNIRTKALIQMIIGILLLLMIFWIPEFGAIVLIAGGIWYLYIKVRHIKL
ncbi:hypothetical protein [Blautia argi]|nr:hypothetical protein [Blautia argi]